MKSGDLQDKRLLERVERTDPSARSANEKAMEALPDLAEASEGPSAADVDKLRQDASAEREARRERIERFVEERKAPPPPRPPVTPINEAEL